jgi:plasmid stability protein
LVEIAEEIAIRREDDGRVFALQRCRIGVHRTVEAEEVRILSEGLGKDAILLGVALAAGDLTLPSRLGADDSRVAVGLAADFLEICSPWARN